MGQRCWFVFHLLSVLPVGVIICAFLSPYGLGYFYFKQNELRTSYPWFVIMQAVLQDHNVYGGARAYNIIDSVADCLFISSSVELIIRNYVCLQYSSICYY